MTYYTQEFRLQHSHNCFVLLEWHVIFVFQYIFIGRSQIYIFTHPIELQIIELTLL